MAKVIAVFDQRQRLALRRDQRSAVGALFPVNPLGPSPWQPFARRFREPLEEIVPIQGPKPFPVGALFPVNPVGPSTWQPFARKFQLPLDEDIPIQGLTEPPKRTNPGGFFPGSVPVGPVPLLVTWQTSHSEKDRYRQIREHQRVVALILNSLLRHFWLIRTDIDTWQLGYTPGQPGNWPGIAPSTVGLALDLLIQLIHSGGGGGPGPTILTGDVTGSGVTTVPTTVVKLQGRAVSAAAPTDAYVLTWVAANSDWEPQPITAVSDVNNILANQIFGG